MKKIFTLVIVSFLSALAVQAQSLKVTKTDGSVVTYNASDISKIEFLPSETPSQPKVLHEFTGYLTVTSKMFTNMYYGDAAKMKVLQDGNKYVAQFSDAQWGTGSFDITLTGKDISGSGKMKIANPKAGGEAKEYAATMSGSMTNIKITIPELMGGVVINWHYGAVPVALKVSGNYSGSTSLTVGPSFGPYDATNVSYKITANEDGTINVTTPKESYAGIMMVGNLTIDSYTVKNLSYDKATNSFVRDYSKDGIKVHLKSDGMMKLDKDYSFQATSKMTVKLGENGALTITNNYNLVGMPMSISATYTGKKVK